MPSSKASLPSLKVSANSISRCTCPLSRRASSLSGSTSSASANARSAASQRCRFISTLPWSMRSCTRVCSRCSRSRASGPASTGFCRCFHSASETTPASSTTASPAMTSARRLRAADPTSSVELPVGPEATSMRNSRLPNRSLSPAAHASSLTRSPLMKLPLAERRSNTSSRVPPSRTRSRACRREMELSSRTTSLPDTRPTNSSSLRSSKMRPS